MRANKSFFKNTITFLWFFWADTSILEELVTGLSYIRAGKGYNPAPKINGNKF
jgi:hypothetical protein